MAVPQATLTLPASSGLYAKVTCSYFEIQSLVLRKLTEKQSNREAKKQEPTNQQANIPAHKQTNKK